jgi:hypothetical protein
MLDLVLDHPSKPCFLFFGNFDFHGVGAIERGDDSYDAIVVETLGVFMSHPPFSFRDRFRHAWFPGLRDEICDVVPESRRHLEGRKFWLLDGVYENRHG